MNQEPEIKCWTTLRRLIVMDKGQVVEQGTARELINRRGYFARLYSLQFGDMDLTA